MCFYFYNERNRGERDVIIFHCNTYIGVYISVRAVRDTTPPNVLSLGRAVLWTRVVRSEQMLHHHIDTH